MKMLRTKLYEIEKKDNEVASAIRTQVGSGDKSEKIRTYNYLQGRITDHRIGMSIYQMENFLNGDLYYHGPRNDLTEGYNPMEVSKILNSLKDKLIVTKGNCDAEVDEMISEFPFKEYVEMKVNGYNLFLSHGHKYNIDSLPPLGVNIDI